MKVLGRATETALSLGQTQAAAQFLEKWISVEPKDPKVWEQALAVHTQLGNKPKMVEDLEQLVRFYPERKELTLQLARLYEEGGPEGQGRRTSTARAWPWIRRTRPCSSSWSPCSSAAEPQGRAAGDPAQDRPGRPRRP